MILGVRARAANSDCGLSGFLPDRGRSPRNRGEHDEEDPQDTFSDVRGEGGFGRAAGAKPSVGFRRLCLRSRFRKLERCSSSDASNRPFDPALLGMSIADPASRTFPFALFEKAFLSYENWWERRDEGRARDDAQRRCPRLLYAASDSRRAFLPPTDLG